MRVGDASLHPLPQRRIVGQHVRADVEPALHRPAAAHLHLGRAWLLEQFLGPLWIDANEQTAVTARGDTHVASDEKRETAEHLLLGVCLFAECSADAVSQV